MSELRQSIEAPLRFLTATSIFDGHDAAINIVRRLLQELGAEVIHLGHNRSVDEIVSAALQEDVQAVAVSAYQGGHMEYFKYLVDRLDQAGAGHIQVFGGGGGTISAADVAELEAYGVEKIYGPEEGFRAGLTAMGEDLIRRTRNAPPAPIPGAVAITDYFSVARCLSLIENNDRDHTVLAAELPHPAPVIGITGSGGTGKSSVVDELLGWFLKHFPSLQIAVLALDPTRHKSGGALLGDRIRLNNAGHPRIYMRSMATRRRDAAVSENLPACIRMLRTVGFGLVMVETVGTGQADLAIVDHTDISLFVMTAEHGAPNQLEKIQMLDYADFMVLNKFDQRGAEDALREIKQQWRDARGAWQLKDEELPVYATVAGRWSDQGIRRLGRELAARLKTFEGFTAVEAAVSDPVPHLHDARLVPARRQTYLAQIAANGRENGDFIEVQARMASLAYSHHRSLQAVVDPDLPESLQFYSDPQLEEENQWQALRRSYQHALKGLSEESLNLLHRPPAAAAWPFPKWPCRIAGTGVINCAF